MRFVPQFFVLLTLQYFVSYSDSIELRYLDFYDGENQYQIKSENYPLKPLDRPIDTVWQCRPSIKLEIKYFELDGQNGDFLMISDVPLDLDKLGTNPDSVEPTDPKFIDAILVSNGLLMSWAVNQSIQIHSEHGTFIYFHAQAPKADGDRRKLFRGFDITVWDYDHLRATTPRPTPEPEQPTPSPGTQIYLSIFLGCNDPKEFVKNKDEFKGHLAVMANKYCNETHYCDDDIPICDGIKNCTETGFNEFTIDEVSIPDKEGIFYCDPKWPVYETCVEVRFAIVRKLSNGTYIMTKERLEEMWNRHSDSLGEEEGYCPYKPPGSEEFKVWIWVAILLGMILVLSALFWVVWIKKSSEEYSRRPSSKKLTTSDDDKAGGIPGFSDRTNPLYKYYKKFQSSKGAEDAKYSEMVNELGSMVESDGPKVRQNQLYQRVHVEQDNPGFSMAEEVEVEFERPDSNLSVTRFPPVNFMNIELDQENPDTEI